MPLSFLLSQTPLRDLEVDFDILLSVIRSMDSLSLSPDELGVRISLPISRNTIIIRDAPKDSTETSIRELLSAFPIEVVKQEVANSWFVTFSSEDYAVKACSYLQSLSHLPHPIKARVKSEFYMKVLMKQLQAVKNKSDSSPSSEMDMQFSYSPVTVATASTTSTASTASTASKMSMNGNEVMNTAGGETETPQRRRKLSIAAKPFNPSNLPATSLPMQSTSDSSLVSRLSLHEGVDDVMQNLGSCWDDPLLKNHSIK